MKIEFTNDDLTEARLTRGRWWWKRTTCVVRVHTERQETRADSSPIRWLYTHQDPTDHKVWEVEHALDRELEVKRQWALIWNDCTHAMKDGAK